MAEDFGKLPSRALSGSGERIRFKEVAKKVGHNMRDTVAVQKANAIGSRPALGSASRKGSSSSMSLAHSGSLVVPGDKMLHRLRNLESEKLEIDKHLKQLNRVLSDSLLDQRRAAIVVGKHQSKVANAESRAHLMQLEITSLRDRLHGAGAGAVEQGPGVTQRRRFPEGPVVSEAPGKADPALSMDLPSPSSSSRGSRALAAGDFGRATLDRDPSDGAHPSLGTGAGPCEGSLSNGVQRDDVDSSHVSFAEIIRAGSPGLQADPPEQVHDAAGDAAEGSDALDEEMLHAWFLMVEDDLRRRYGESHGHALGRIVDPDVESMVQETLESVQDRHRETIRSRMITAAGSEIRAFKAMDYNGSGRICLGDFSGGVERLGVPWKAIMGTTNPKHLFKLFDVRRKGTLRFKDLFPDANPYLEPEGGDSTPDLYRKWCRRQTQDPAVMTRQARWVPVTVEDIAAAAFKEQDRQNEVAEAKQRMASMIKRLRSRGKSSARCREISALHLPPGTGPEDMQGVKTFSQAEATECKRLYAEKVFETSRDVQKYLYEMREQAKELKKAKHALYVATDDPLQRLSDEAKAPLSVLASMLGKGRDTAEGT